MNISLPQLEKVEQGYVIYDGPSLINGERIIAVASGFQRSRNAKVGKGAVQVWILVANTKLITALQDGFSKQVASLGAKETDGCENDSDVIAVLKQVVKDLGGEIIDNPIMSGSNVYGFIYRKKPLA